MKVESALLSTLICIRELASFPGSPLCREEIKKDGGEPGTNSHVISRYNDITALDKVVMSSHSHVIRTILDASNTIVCEGCTEVLKSEDPARPTYKK